MIQTGFVGQLLKKYKKSYRISGFNCLRIGGNDSNDKSFGLDVVVSLFVVLLIGLLAGIVVFALEYTIAMSNNFCRKLLTIVKKK